MDFACAPPYDQDLPAYTRDTEPERRVPRIAGPSPSGPLQEYEYKNGNIKINLGRRRDGVFRPAYGWNDTIEGFVQVKKLKNVQSIVVSVEGNVSTGLSERGFLTEVSKTRVLHMSQTLFDASAGQSFPAGGTRYAFSFSLPSYVTGGTKPLPPTFNALHPGVSGDVTYYIKVDLVRQGMLRQNERLKAFFYYLPRTYALVPQLAYGNEKPGDWSEWHIASVRPKLPLRADPTSASDLYVSVAFPRPLEFSAGSAIPFYLTVASGSTMGALPMLFSGLSVQLVRATVMKVGDQKSSCETVIGGGEVFRIEQRGDARAMFGSVRCGKRGESSWAVAGVEVKHIVRVTLAPREDIPSLTCTLPTYMHEQVVTMRTHERGWNGEDDERQPDLASAPRSPTVR